MDRTDFYLIGFASGAGFMLLVCVFALVAVWPDLKQRYRGRG